MPGPSRSQTRRQALVSGGLLGLAAAGSLTGCGRGTPRPAPSTPAAPTPSVDPDAAVRETARLAEEELLALHRATA
ncbi:MAG TPA: hypothetical protein VK894_09545, partial [Jiangellales bacterium]|nr:hypothetical protein [Jiangellales bacterium]